MGEKNNGNKKAGDKQNKENASLTVVLKVDCLCEGCASKILKCVRELEGVETVKTESNSNKVTVIGAVDPTAIKDNIAKKSKKKAPLTTVDLKVQLKCQCQGCILKIRRIVFETKGVHELKVDTQKELVTVKGTMDVKALAEALKDKLKKNVEIVPPPKKEKESNKDGGNDGGNSGGKKNKKGGNGGNDANSNAATDGGGGGKNKTEGNRMGFMAQPEYGYGYTPCYPGYGQPGYGYYYGHPLPHGYGHCYPGYGPNYPVFVHPPHQMFNDENANACAIL